MVSNSYSQPQCSSTILNTSQWSFKIFQGEHPQEFLRSWLGRCHQVADILATARCKKRKIERPMKRWPPPAPEQRGHKTNMEGHVHCCKIMPNHAKSTDFSWAENMQTNKRPLKTQLREAAVSRNLTDFRIQVNTLVKSKSIEDMLIRRSAGHRNLHGPWLKIWGRMSFSGRKETLKVKCKRWQNLCSQPALANRPPAVHFFHALS